jgi:hypothetical protein
VHVQKKLDKHLARNFLRAIGELVKLRDQFAELSNLILKCTVVCHMPPMQSETSVSRDPS